MQMFENLAAEAWKRVASAITWSREIGPLKAATLMPKIALRGRENLKLRAIRLRGKNLGLDIGLLRLSDSAANTAVAAFTSLAKATVPKLVGR